MQELALATDSQLRYIAKTKANYDYAASPKRKAERNFATMIPVMDSFLLGAGTKGTLGQKVVAGGNQLKDWGIFLVVTSLYNKMVNKIVDKSETLQKFRDNSPYTYGIANAAVGVTVGISGIHYVNKGFQRFISPLIPNRLKEVAKGFIEGTDNSNFGKVINNSMQNFAQKYPKISKVLGTTARWAMPVLCLGFLASMAIDIIKTKSNENKTFKQLSDARLAVAQELAAQNAQKS